MKALPLRCPGCGAPLRAREPNVLVCADRGHTFGEVQGLPDLRIGASAPGGWPVGNEALESALERLAARTPWRQGIEQLLLELDEVSADRTMQLARESRGAWVPMLAARGGRALLCGNALSGTAVALARCGFEVTLFEPDPLRLALARERAAALAPETTRLVCGGDGAHLPFDDAAFDVVIQEDGLPCKERGWGHGVGELQRVARRELALVAQNRLAYKTSDLRRGQYRVPGPVEYVGRALRPSRAERTLAGYRRLVGKGARAFALYPHSDDFSFVVGLDGTGPALSVGPKERANRLKVVAERAGLFPLLTPSFLVLARYGVVPDSAAVAATTWRSQTSCGDGRRIGYDSVPGEPARLELVLDALAESTHEPRPQVETLVATRGQTAVALTAVPGAAEDDPRGRWCLHLPLCPAQEAQVERHVRVLRSVRKRFAGVPVPEPLHWGRLEGLPVACERRLGGLTAPQLSGRTDCTDRMVSAVGAQLARLVVEPPAVCDERRFEQVLGRRFALVARHAHRESTLAEIERLRALAREALLGRSWPLVLTHQDLRGKHVQVSDEGEVLGLLDWGTADESGLPYFDLVHLVVHERKQADDLTAGEAWRLVADGRALREAERAALDAYATALGLDQDYRKVIGAIYPILVAAMAEAHWDYSRPRWLHRQFGI